MSLRRVLISVRVILGTLLAASPDTILARIVRRPSRGGERALTRLLGARNLVEAVVTARDRNPSWLRVSAAIDATHALSMVALAARKPAHRRLATASALTAAGTAIATACATPRLRRRSRQ